MKLACGIDPGLHGAIAIVGDDGKEFLIDDMPLVRAKRDRIDPAGVRDLLEPLSRPRACGPSRAAAVFNLLIRDLGLRMRVPFLRVRPQRRVRSMLRRRSSRSLAVSATS